MFGILMKSVIKFGMW